MAELGSLLVRIGADISQLQRAYRDVKAATEQLANGLQSAGRSLTQNVTLPLIGLGTASVVAAGNLQRARLGLETVAGSAEEAQAQLERLRVLARNPGLGFRQAIDASVKLQTLGFSAQQAEAAVRELGNAVALTGGTREDFGEISRQFAQIRSLGRLTAENLNVIIERSPAVAAAMQAAFGTASAEAIRESGLSIDEFFARLQQGLETLPRAQASILDTFGNLKDDITTALAPLGEAIAAQLIPVLTRLVEFITKVSDAFKNLSPETQKWIVFAGVAVAAIGPLLIGLGGLLKLLPLLTTGIYSFGLAFGPIGPLAIAAGAAFLIVYRRSEELRETVKRLGDLIVDSGRAFVDLGKSLLIVADRFGLVNRETGEASNGLRTFLGFLNRLPLEAIGHAIFIVTGYVRGLAAAFEVLASGKATGVIDFIGRVIDRVRALSAAAATAAVTMSKLLGSKGDTGPKGGENPFTPIGDGAAEAADDVRTIIDVLDELEQALLLTARRVSAGLIDPLETATETARLVRQALEEALTVPGTTDQHVADLRVQLDEADKALRRIIESAATANAEMRAWKEEAAELAERMALVASRMKFAVDQISKPESFGGEKGPLGFFQSLNNVFLDLAETLTGDVADALGDAVAGFRSFGEAMRLILRRLIADLVAAIAKMLLFRALGTLIGGPLGGGLAGGIASTIGAVAGGGTVRLEIGGGARPVEGGFFVPVQGGWLRAARTEQAIERGAGLSGSLS